MPRTYYVYILASHTRTLYTGVTNDLVRRLSEHRSGIGSVFTRRYSIRRLVHVEAATNARDAIARETQIKRWTRHKKIALIEATNPTWEELSPQVIPSGGPQARSRGIAIVPEEGLLCREARDSSTRCARSE